MRVSQKGLASHSEGNRRVSASQNRFARHSERKPEEKVEQFIY
ncbi:hypothetical protein MKX67_08635 [Cytobacillus sp. FSL W7-1323]|nr:hypothetical protein [Cytobacillus sp. OWB-43]MEA1851727.1 hypothetical protein [Cytobacillus sp. OWB-43]